MKGLLRYRWWIAGILTIAIAATDWSTPADLVYFGDLGGRILHGHLADAYAGDVDQAGPLQLLLSRLLLLGGHRGQAAIPTRVVLDLALVFGAMALNRGRPVREAVLGVLALLWIVGPVPFQGHPPEVAIAMLWAYAMVLQRRTQWLPAAVALGLGILIAPIAVLGFPCLLAVGSPRSVVRTWIVAAMVAAFGYLPFVLTGSFGVFGHTWPVMPTTTPWFLGLTQVTWGLRLVQAVVVAGGCGIAAYLCRNRAAALGAAPLTAGLLRVATDPQTMAYYWLPAAVGGLLLVAFMPDGGWWWFSVGLSYLAMISAVTLNAVIGAWSCLVLLGIYLGTTLRVFHFSSQRQGQPALIPDSSSGTMRKA